MSTLNFKHLRYFWMVAKTGSIARAAEQLHLTPQSISGQLSEFADTLGVELFRRSGRQLELTDTGRRILSHAEEIFSTGDELLEIVRDQSRTTTTTYRVGFADSVSKLIACRLVEPALSLAEPLRMICREGRLASLLADLAVHRLDLIIADRPMPAHLSVRGFNHLLGESGMTLFGTRALAATLSGEFPQCLHRAPLLLPGEDFAIYGRLLQWLGENNLHPRIVGEFDDRDQFNLGITAEIRQRKMFKKHVTQRRLKIHEPVGLVECPPNWWRSAATILLAGELSSREANLAKRAAVMAGAGTALAIASSTVQRPSPESST